MTGGDIVLLYITISVLATTLCSGIVVTVSVSRRFAMRSRRIRERSRINTDDLLFSLHPVA